MVIFASKDGLYLLLGGNEQRLFLYSVIFFIGYVFFCSDIINYFLVSRLILLSHGVWINVHVCVVLQRDIQFALTGTGDTGVVHSERSLTSCSHSFSWKTAANTS